MISVIIPLYNKENSISDTVLSVLNQTYKNFELIIVNDGSKDNSLAVVNNISDSRIRIIDKSNGGVSSARNLGILNAKNEYIAFLDGDDIWYEKHLEVLTVALEKINSEEVGGIGTTFYKSNSKVFDLSKYRKVEAEIVENYFKFMTSPKPRFNSSTLLVKKSKVLETGLFNENLKYGEDVEFWYKLFSRYKLGYVDTVTTIYFVAAENRSTHYVIPLDKRFIIYEYKNKSNHEKNYLDKLVALALIDYFGQSAYKEMFKVLGLYFNRLIGASIYVLKLIEYKIKK